MLHVPEHLAPSHQTRHVQVLHRYSMQDGTIVHIIGQSTNAKAPYRNLISRSNGWSHVTLRRKHRTCAILYFPTAGFCSPVTFTVTIIGSWQHQGVCCARPHNEGCLLAAIDQVYLRCPGWHALRRSNQHTTSRIFSLLFSSNKTTEQRIDRVSPTK